jgi:hypothetical protein
MISRDLKKAEFASLSIDNIEKSEHNHKGIFYRHMVFAPLSYRPFGRSGCESGD